MDINLIESSGKTVVRICFDELTYKINEMEFLKVIAENKKTLRLSNGLTMARECLFPYHKQNYYRGEKYFFLEKIVF